MNEQIIESGTDWKLCEYSDNSHIVYCDTWNGYLDFLHSDKALKMNNNYYYRGHASEEWKLDSTLARNIPNAESNIDELKLKLRNLFKIHCLGRRGHNPPLLDENELWALGQHFGLFTPLLDWTESPYIAAFFAFNSNQHTTDNVVIWALAKNINKLLKIKSNEEKLKFIHPYLDENSRLISQRGLFVLTPQMRSVEEWANEHINDSDSITLAKILISASEKKFALDSLDKMNINNYSLFPDLIGAARHANYLFSK